VNRFMELCFTDPGGRPLRQGRLHVELQQFLNEHHKALIELPRDHGKTMQVCSRVLWELGNDPSLRVKIVCSSEAVAAERGRFLLTALQRNRALRACFPGLRPTVPQSSTRFSVQRPANVIGPSVTAIGVGASLTGTRADLLVCDDIVDVKAIASRNERERIKKYFRDNLMNLLEPDGRCWCLFTPWHDADLNSELKKNAAFAHFCRAIDADMTPIWPERWPREKLEERCREIGTTSFARGYRLLPLAPDAMPIRPEWIRVWLDERPFERVVLSIDPAVSVRAQADASALVVLGLTAGNEIRCLEATARRVNAPDLMQSIDDADRRHRPDVILFESNAAFAGIKDLLIRHARYGPKIQGVIQSREKAARVSSFSVLVENGSFRLKGDSHGEVDAGQQVLRDEMMTFPAGEHDDLLDAAATGSAWLLDHREPRVW